MENYLLTVAQTLGGAADLLEIQGQVNKAHEVFLLTNEKLVCVGIELIEDAGEPVFVVTLME